MSLGAYAPYNMAGMGINSLTGDSYMNDLAAHLAEDPDMSLASEDQPRVLLMGPKRSGKTSIQRVVFHKMSPHETLFLESTSSLEIVPVGTPHCGVGLGFVGLD